MEPGDVVLGRFEVERFAGSGGMGDLYFGRDRQTRAPVALKTIHFSKDGREENRARFLREVKILSELRGPHVVRYVAHGESSKEGGEIVLAMEWLEGETLAARLGRGRLGVRETQRLALQVAEGLAEAHARGIVHRDIKPANIFLVRHDIDAVRLLDFGLAWWDADTSLTRSGRVVGTFGYIAPELARGVREIGPRADVFSLGCVLYECLAGESPFRGRVPTSTLMRVVYAEPAPLRIARPEVPSTFAALVHRMLAKEASARPPNGAAIVAELDAMAPVSRPGSATNTRPPPALTESERRTIVFVLASLAQDAAEGFAQPHEVLRLAPELRAVAESHGARLELMIGPLVVVTIMGSQAATDLAARAVRCAMDVQCILPRVAMAIATGQGDASARVRATTVLEMAGSLLETSAADARERNASLPIRLDETTAGLLDVRFDVGGDERGLILRGEREVIDHRRTLLRCATPFVGRAREIAMLDTAFHECIRHRAADVMLVTAEAGGGKSRLRRQLLDTWRAELPAASVWLAFGRPHDPPHAALGRLVRSAANIGDDDAMAVRWQKLRARVARHVEAREVQRVAEFLAEPIAPRTLDAGAPLLAARQDGMLMAMQTRRAVRDLVEAECAHAPLAIVIDDVHWLDLATMDLLEETIRAARAHPLLVLAFGRDEARAHVPSRWTARHLRLSPLRDDAGAELVRAVLGDAVAPTQLSGILARAAGNPFYLEELIRSFAAGRGDSPGTVMAMVRSRIEGLDATTRRVLRAASIFGERFEEAGVSALVGDATNVSASLAALVDAELIDREAMALAFAHTLVREAAYAMLTPEDCALGHGLAARWLASQPAANPATIAEHFQRGGLRALAVPWFVRAADAALHANDVVAAGAIAERGIACGATGEALTALRLVKMEIDAWSTVPSEEWRRIADGLDIPRWTARGCRFAGVQATVRARLGDHEGLYAIARDFLALEPSHDAVDAWTLGAALIGLNLLRFGEASLSRSLLARVRTFDTTDPYTRGWKAIFGARASASLRADPWGQLALADEALENFRRSDDPRATALAQSMAAEALTAQGRPSEAETRARIAVANAETMRFPVNAALSLIALTGALLEQSHLEEALVASENAYRAADATPVHQASARLLRARALIAQGHRDAALAIAREAAATPAQAMPMHAEARAVLAMLLASTGAIAEARAVSLEAMAHLAYAVGHVESLVRLAVIEVAMASADYAAARGFAVEAARRLYERAAFAGDDDARQVFLTRVPENARTLHLAERLRD